MFENPTVSLHALCSSCANIGCCSSELIFAFPNADRNIQNASEQCVSCIHLSSVNFALRPTPQNKNLTELGPGDSSSSVWVPIQNLTHVRINLFFFLTTTDTAPTQNIDISSRITLYLRVEQANFSRCN
jgi:hypothetical protein